MQILGIKIDEVTWEIALEKVSSFLSDGKQHAIFTPNPEMLVKAQKDEYFREVVNRGDLNICDGKGIQLVSKQKIERIPGSDFMVDICRLAAEQGRGVYLFGSGNDEIVSKAAANLEKKLPGLKIAGYNKGPAISENGASLVISEEENNKLILDISSKYPDILFVAFGMGKQEKWIHENLHKMSSVKIAMGVGGAFDYISGKVPRAPLLMRKLGLEWLYRLVVQPARFGRIFNATIKFIWLVIKEKI